MAVFALFGATLVAFRGGARADGGDGDVEAAEPDPAADIYRLAALPPFFERRIELILQAERQQAQQSAEKVGLRRMSRKKYRRALVALAHSTDAKIRALIGAKKFAAWKRARADEARRTASAGSLGRDHEAAERLPASASAPVGSRRDRCAALGRLLRGSALESMTAEEAHVWIYDHARHC